MVNGFAVHAENAGQTIARRLDGNATTHRTSGTGALDLLEVPRSGGEAIRLSGQCANGTNLNSVAGEDRVKGLGRRWCDFDLVATTGKVNLSVAGNFCGESGTTAALDATLTVEQNELTDFDGLGKVALLFDETGFTRSVGQRLVLKRTFATLVAHGAVERVVGQQELQDTVLGLLDLLALRVDDHAFTDLDVTGGLQRGATGTIDFNETHATDTDGLHARVVAKAWDVRSHAVGRRDQHLTLGCGDFASINGESNGRPCFEGVSHGGIRCGRREQ